MALGGEAGGRCAHSSAPPPAAGVPATHQGHLGTFNMLNPASSHSRNTLDDGEDEQASKQQAAPGAKCTTGSPSLTRAGVPPSSPPAPARVPHGAAPNVAAFPARGVRVAGAPALLTWKVFPVTSNSGGTNAPSGSSAEAEDGLGSRATHPGAREQESGGREGRHWGLFPPPPVGAWAPGVEETVLRK